MVPSMDPVLGCPIGGQLGHLQRVPSRSYIYQRRWVKLDAEHLRYFDSEKVRWGLGLVGRRWQRRCPCGAASCWVSQGAAGVGAGVMLVGCGMLGLLSALRAWGGPHPIIPRPP